MHPAAYDWTFQSFHNWRKDKNNLVVLEIGSLDINGSIKKIFEPFAASYIGIDPQAGPGVDVVISGTEYSNPGHFDVVVTCETFEHTPDWKAIIKQSYDNLKFDGIFIATMAGEGRPPHSAVDEKPIRDWEYYANVGEWDLRQSLKQFKTINTNYRHNDLRCWALK